MTKQEAEHFSNPFSEDAGCCGKNSICLDSRRRNGYRYRRYSCQACGNRFSSAEIVVPAEIDIHGGRGAFKGLALHLLGLTESQKNALDNFIDAFVPDKDAEQPDA